MDLPQVALGPARYNAILTIVDKFSKYCRLIPVYLGEGEMSAPQAAAIFYDHVVRLFGVPKAIVSDRDPRFTADFWGSLWRILGTKVLLSSAYHLQTDGQSERQNRTVEQVIRCLISFGVTDWY